MSKADEAPETRMMEHVSNTTNIGQRISANIEIDRYFPAHVSLTTLQSRQNGPQRTSLFHRRIKHLQPQYKTWNVNIRNILQVFTQKIVP